MIYSLLPDDIGFDPRSVPMPVLIPHDATGAHYDGGIILGSPEDIVAGLQSAGYRATLY